MVYCRYCGEKNKDEALICGKCGKPLSLIPNLYPKNMNKSMPNYNNKNEINRGFRKNKGNNHNNFNRGPIKSRFENLNRDDEIFNKDEYGNTLTEELNPSSTFQRGYYYDFSGKNLKKHNKNFVEWDVVVATALLVIILATILQRFFPTFGLFMALFIGLIYILTSTKSKSSLFKAIPLAIIMVFAISAYFTL
ncbi:MAG: zinc ribbon domain-containing protein [Methanobrevibacter sp.]|nr:zinc ribbon domain-containing protein [Methanobrevibacter sp.]